MTNDDADLRDAAGQDGQDGYDASAPAPAALLVNAALANRVAALEREVAALKSQLDGEVTDLKEQLLRVVLGMRGMQETAR